MSRSRSHSRHTPPRLAAASEILAVPFIDAEEAWFWYMQAQRARAEGGRFRGSGATTRPCDPDDLYRAVMGLARRRLIGPEHLKVLARFGYLEYPPDPRVRDQVGAHNLWCQALDRLTTVLKSKGIIDAGQDRGIIDA